MTCGKCQDRGECRHALFELPDDDLKEAFSLYSRSHTQMRAVFGGVIGLDYNAVKLVADIYGVELDAWMMDCIQVLEADELSEQNEAHKKA